jgi:hypothetical protein
MIFKSLDQQLNWFLAIGVDQFNFSILTDRGMLNHDRPRSAEEVLRSAGWGWSKNTRGSNIYIRPARSFSFPVVMFDDLDRLKIDKICKKYSCLAIETSKNNYQVWISTTLSLGEAQRAAVQTAIANLIGADPGSTSGEHFGRAAGFRNQKPGRGGFLVSVRSSRRDLHALDPTPYLVSPSPTGGRVPSSRLIPRHHHHPADGDQSAVEFRFALARLRVGDQPHEIAKKIASRALDRGKRRTAADCEAYAVSTVKKAAAYV